MRERGRTCLYVFVLLFTTALTLNCESGQFSSQFRCYRKTSLQDVLFDLQKKLVPAKKEKDKTRVKTSALFIATKLQ